jgi:hypothetical protein
MENIIKHKYEEHFVTMEGIIFSEINIDDFIKELNY